MTSQPERRLAAIMSADVAGYSRLMAADEEATVRRIVAYREEVELLVRRHRGRLVDFTGDNFLVEFPSALDAVQAAVEIQRVIAALNAGLAFEERMEFRIGLHLGDVREEGGRLFGDGVNIAARLEPNAPPGGLCLSAAIHEQVASHVALTYADLGALALKNIPQPVRAWSASLAAAAAVRRGRALRRVVIGISGALALAGLALWASWPRPLGFLLDHMGITAQPETPPLPDVPSLVVLPFANLSDDPAQAHFAAGITEELTAAFARVPGLFVISRSSAFSYEGKLVRVEDVGRELGVRYVLEGSVRRAGDQLRITAQLTDATRGFQLWSQRYDRKLSDVFAVQSEITTAIITSLDPELKADVRERIRVRPTESISAYDAFLAGRSHIRLQTRLGNLEAERLFQRTLGIDADYAPALAMLGQTYLQRYQWCWNLNPDGNRRAVELFHRALAIDPSLADAHYGLGWAEMLEGRFAQAIPRLERAVELAPSLDIHRLGLSAAQSSAGRPLAGLRTLQSALRLSPKPNPAALSVMVLAQYASGRVEQALRAAESVRQTYPEQLPALLWLTSQYEGAGRHAEAKEVVAEVLAVNPDLRVAQLGQCNRGMTEAELALLSENLRRAGLP